MPRLTPEQMFDTMLTSALDLLLQAEDLYEVARRPVDARVQVATSAWADAHRAAGIAVTALAHAVRDGVVSKTEALAVVDLLNETISDGPARRRLIDALAVRSGSPRI